uniref:protein DOS2-like n=1 Tax=Erigeron canadensis TaxID=72917 RepID=UPI001CB8DBF6|nr:protein DOS2-like [Erigeron canadensis]
MNFFSSVFSDDPDPSEPETPNSPPNPNPPYIPTITSAWTFGTTLMQTLASKSESVLETYRRDLHEFSSGIKLETSVIRDAAVKAVNNLPASLEAGADLAQNSLESVGQAIDDLGSTVTEIIAHGKDSILAVDYSDSDNDNANNSSSYNNVDRNDNKLGLAKPYSRLDAQIRTIRSDMNTYLNDPEDLVEFNGWKLGFKIDEMVGEIEEVLREDDGVVEEIYKEIVPERVEEGVFWLRYFYRVYRVKKAEEARVKLVTRAISGEEDEELSWDVDEDEYEENAEGDLRVEEKEGVALGKDDGEGTGGSGLKDGDRNETEVEKLEKKDDVKTVSSEGKTDRDSDISIVSSQPSPDEDGWDEIEDIGSNDENKEKVEKVVTHESPDRAELRKQLNVAEEEEDLTWDIEDDDDEPVKA